MRKYIIWRNVVHFTTASYQIILMPLLYILACVCNCYYCIVGLYVYFAWIDLFDLQMFVSPHPSLTLSCLMIWPWWWRLAQREQKSSVSIWAFNKRITTILSSGCQAHTSTKCLHTPTHTYTVYYHLNLEREELTEERTSK